MLTPATCCARREDVQTAAGLSAEDAAELWNNIASGAETGMDFSSRWFADGETMQTIRTSSLIPTDLNALLYQVRKGALLSNSDGHLLPSALFLEPVHVPGWSPACDVQCMCSPKHQPVFQASW